MRFGSLILLIVVSLPTALLADPITYNYTGNNFTAVFASYEPQVYTTSDFISVVLTFASPLAPGLSPASDAPLLHHVRWSSNDNRWGCDLAAYPGGDQCGGTN
jgi:hypothetical protein